MIKRMSILSLAAAAAALAAPCALADTVSTRADIPFDFVVADQQLPSGEYTFVQGDKPGVVHIYSKTQGHLAIALCQPTREPSGWPVVLEFEKTGDRHVLKLIRNGERFGAYFPKTRTDKAIAARAEAAAAVGLP